MTNEPTPPSADDGMGEAPGPWDTPAGLLIAQEYATKTRADLMMGHLSDLALANAQYLVSRGDLRLIHFQTAAKERIRWLSVQLHRALASPTPKPNDATMVAVHDQFLRHIGMLPVFNNWLANGGGIDMSLASPTPQVEPVAYLYESEDGDKDLLLDCNGEYARRLIELGRTETPLYAQITPLQQLQALGQEMDGADLRDALTKCRDQFQFYANEHFNAGKLEKAATNQSFADMADRALGCPSDTSPIIETAEPDHCMSVFETGGEGDVVVFPIDREAALSFMSATGRVRADLYGKAIRAGEWDHTDDIQAFARHRLATLQPADKDGEKLRIAWWNDMRERGVSQDVAIAKISAALGQPS